MTIVTETTKIVRTEIMLEEVSVAVDEDEEEAVVKATNGTMKTVAKEETRAASRIDLQDNQESSTSQTQTQTFRNSMWRITSSM